MSPPDESLPQKLQAVRESLPPLEGRKSRLGYPSKDDFAAAVGVTRTRIYAWYRGEGYPDSAAAERLAALSGGRYTADDFRNPTNGSSQRAATLAELVALMQAGRKAQEEQWTKIQELSDAVDAVRKAVENLDASVRLVLQRPNSGHGRQQHGS